MSDRDAAERAQLLRIAVLLGPPMLLIGGFTIYFAYRQYHPPAGVLLAALLVLPPATWGAILLVELVTARSASGVITTLHAARATPARTGFSRQEALVARGKFEEAAAAYRAHLAEEPNDVAALVALGRLLGGPLADPDGAAGAYLAARRLEPGKAWERVIGNDLIDLHRRSGDEGRLKVELARFANANSGTKEGTAAADRLRELKSGATGKS